MKAFGDFASDPGQAAGMTFEMVAPMVKTLGATARLGWDPYLHNPKLRGRLWRVDCPTLVVHATSDTLVPGEHAAAYAEEIAGAELVEMPEAAHLVPLEKPAELANLIRAFVTRTRP
jgi:pimeloyl-ACP methyl ester carboxylesterase